MARPQEAPTHSWQQVRRLVEPQLEGHPEVNPCRNRVSRLDDHLPASPSRHAPPSQAPRASVPAPSPRLPEVESADTKVTAAEVATNTHTHNRRRGQVFACNHSSFTACGCSLAAVRPVVRPEHKLSGTSNAGPPLPPRLRALFWRKRLKSMRQHRGERGHAHGYPCLVVLSSDPPR